MKTCTLLLVFTSGLAFAQPDSLAPLRRTDLKPIEFRELPYQVTTHDWHNNGPNNWPRSTTRTRVERTYTYDGIDVPDPERTLWPTLLALGDPDVQRTHQAYNRIMSQRQSAGLAGGLVMGLGLLVAVAGQAGQSRSVQQWGTSSYSAPSPSSGGAGAMIGGVLIMGVGGVIAYAGQGDRAGTFLRAVQYYNRALQRREKVSFRLLPVSSEGLLGPSVQARF